MIWKIEGRSANSGVKVGDLLELDPALNDITFYPTGVTWGSVPTGGTAKDVKLPVVEPVEIYTHRGTASGKDFVMITNDTTAVCLIVGSPDCEWWNAKKN